MSNNKTIELNAEVSVFLAQARAAVDIAQAQLEMALRAIAISNGVNSGKVSLDGTGTKLIVGDSQ